MTMISLRSASASLQEKMARFGLDSPTKDRSENPLVPPLVSSYNDRIRPLLDAIDRLRHMKVMEEGIQLPTIVVVGDQSSGKSSVLESLAGISLPRGQGICTRVPLIMRLQNVPTDEQVQHLLQLEYQGKTVPTSEDEISDAIRTATDEIAGSGKAISNTPLTLIVRKKGVPDLTMVDLPGITRVPIHGQPENIYEQISTIIMEYIKPSESIILNVLSATVDFPTCESIRMSQSVDKTGERTLAVVTKSDKAPEGLLEKVTTDDVNIGLGYVCVRNRIGDESYEEARIEEARLFESNPLLSKIDKSIVGVPVLAQKLVQIQASSIRKCLPGIVTKISDKLNKNVAELNNMPQNLSSVADAMQAFMRVIGAAKESLKNILIRGEFEDFPDDPKMHCTARMAEILDEYYNDLKSKSLDDDLVTNRNFLMLEISVLEETKGIGLPNFLPRTAFLVLLQRKVNSVALVPVDFVHKVLKYIEEVVIRIVSEHSEDYVELQSMTKRAVHNLIDKMRDRSVKHVKEIIQMEKIADYTSNPDYVKSWNSLMENQVGFMAVIRDPSMGTQVTLQGIGANIEVGHLRQYSQSMLEQAFDMRMRLTAYWRIALQRLVDALALYLLFSVKNLVEGELEAEIVKEVMGSQKGGIERMLEESPSTALKRGRLNRSISLLRESKDVVANIMDRIAASGTD